MLVLNLKLNQHKIIEKTSTDTESSSGIYGMSTPKRTTTSTKSSSARTARTRVFGAAPVQKSAKTVLTDEQKEYLKIYEEQHDKLFGPAEKKDKTVVRVFVEQEVPSVKKITRKQTGKSQTEVVVKEDEKQLETVAVQPEVQEESVRIAPRFVKTNQPVETKAVIQEPAVEDTVEETTIEPVVEEAKKKDNWFKRFFEAIKRFFKKIFSKKKEEVK